MSYSARQHSVFVADCLDSLPVSLFADVLLVRLFLQRYQTSLTSAHLRKGGEPKP